MLCASCVAGMSGDATNGCRANGGEKSTCGDGADGDGGDQGGEDGARRRVVEDAVVLLAEGAGTRPAGSSSDGTNGDKDAAEAGGR